MTPKTLITVHNGPISYIKKMLHSFDVEFKDLPNLIQEQVESEARVLVQSLNTNKNAKGVKPTVRVWQLVAEVEKGEI